MRRNVSRLSIVLIALSALAACASDPQAGISFDPLERFPAEALWRWDDTANVLPEDPRLAPMQLDSVLRDAVSAELTAHGYREAGSNQSDYLVSYELRLTTRVRPETSISVASLSLLIREAATRRRVWLAFLQTEIDVSRSDAERRKRVREVVARMLRDFPPQHGGG
jgi:hypothetical protein